MSFGKLYCIDIYNVDKDILDSVGFFHEFLNDLVQFLGMHKQCEPLVFGGDTDMYPIKGTGISGWVALIESGIQVHTVSAKNFFSLDIYTCGELNQAKTLDYVWVALRGNRPLNPDEIETHYIDRGLKYKE